MPISLDDVRVSAAQNIALSSVTSEYLYRVTGGVAVPLPNRPPTPIALLLSTNVATLYSMTAAMTLASHARQDGSCLFWGDVVDWPLRISNACPEKSLPRPLRLPFPLVGSTILR